MAEHVEKVLNGAIDGLRKMIDVDSVLGSPVKVSENTTIIPVTKVSMGFVSGGAGADKKPAADNFGGGAGGGVKIIPIAFLVISDDNVRLVNVSENPDGTDKLLTKIPEIIDQISTLIKNKKDKEAE